MIFLTNDVEKLNNYPDPDGGTEIDPKGPSNPDEETDTGEEENP